MNRFVLALVLAVVAAFWSVTAIFATSEEQGWSRTTTQGATASFSIKHDAKLYTKGTVSISRTLRDSSTVGEQVIDLVQIDGQLVQCQADSCVTIWTFSGERDVSGTSNLRIENGSVSLTDDLPITIGVNDFADVDNDGDRGELIGSFVVQAPLTVAWEIAPEPNLCGKGEAAGNAISAELIQPANFSGNLTGHALNSISAQASRTDTIYGKGPGGTCA